VDWVQWHADYDKAGSPLAHRLEFVKEQVRAALDRAPAGPVTVISMCAGQGRDLLEVVATHPRGPDVRARLVELDPACVATARAVAPAGIEVVEGDAGLVDAYEGMAPAQLVLACGVFGNISDADIERTIEYCGQLCEEGGTVVWTRIREAPDFVPVLCGWFERDGFEQVSVTPPELGFCVGAHRRVETPKPLRTGGRMFEFVERRR
jgi:hypothetical protein